MKASLKFRDEQKPLFRAKVPLNIIGFPFQSGVVAGESKELSLQLSTFFESGPSLKIAYRPNDTWNPFSLIVKTGTGSFGSPNSSSMMMSAEFNLLGQGNNPSFFLHFKPQFGDFSIKKSQSSVFKPKFASQTNGVGSDDDNLVEIVENPVVENGVLSGKKMNVFSANSPLAGMVNGLLCGADVSASTVMPVRNQAMVKLRWGIRFPEEAKNVFTNGAAKNRAAGFSFKKIPFLVMNKISIEHVDERDSAAASNVRPDSNLSSNSEVLATCFAVKHQLEALQSENGSLRKAVEDLRSELASGKSVLPAGAVESKSPGRKVDRRNEKTSTDFSGFTGKGSEGDVSEESKKKH